MAASHAGRESGGDRPADAGGEITIVVADRNAVVRRGLRQLLAGEDGFAVLAEAADLESARRSVRLHDPHVLVLDLSLPGGSSLAAIRELRAEAPRTEIVVLTMQGEPGEARRAIDAGAVGYVLEDAADAELVEAVRAAAAGERHISPRLATAAAPRRPGALSEREVEVLRMIALGHTNAQIAGELALSVRTVETHRAHIQQKLRLSDRSELVRYALDHGLVRPGG